MDVIILAAGENMRLQAAGLAPGLKPLIIVENEVLIRRLCRQARDAYGSHIVIVCSPSNAREIVYATKDYASHYVLQPEAVGPCDAVDRALPLTRSSHVMLLMGDNYLKDIPHTYDEMNILTVQDSEDTALHKVLNGKLVPNDYEWDARWLGPLTFERKKWRTGKAQWVDALRDITFTCVWDTDAQDMGVLR